MDALVLQQSQTSKNIAYYRAKPNGEPVQAYELEALKQWIDLKLRAVR
jgi:hypothetical protein